VVTNSGDLDGTELYYYQKHQVIEVRDGSENVIRQIIHGRRYIDEVVLEILEDGVVWVHQDANWNVIALTDFAGRVLEHYYQTPYGIMTVDQESYFGDSDGDGKVTEDEWDTDEDGQLDSDDDCWGSDPSGNCRLVDFDFDGDVDATDATRLAELDSTTTYRQPGQACSGIGNTRAHQGLIYDAEIGSYNNRARQYAPQIERFMQRDALRPNPHATSAYQDGVSLYTYVRTNPNTWVDPLGTVPECPPGTEQSGPPSEPIFVPNPGDFEECFVVPSSIPGYYLDEQGHACRCDVPTIAEICCDYVHPECLMTAVLCFDFLSGEYIAVVEVDCSGAEGPPAEICHSESLTIDTEWCTPLGEVT